MRARQIMVTALVMTAAACSSADSSAPVTATGSTSVAPASSRPGETATSAPVSSATSTTTSLPPPLPEAPPAIASPGSNKLLVLGDSVILGAKNTIPAALKGWDVTFDARESRFISDGLNVLKAHKSDYDKLKGLAYADLEQAYKDAGMAPPKPEPPASIIDVLGRVVVINLCTNYQAGGGFDKYIEQIMTYLKGIDRVVWVTCAEWSPGQSEANAAIRAAARTYPNIMVADWASFSPTPGYTYDDNIHLREAGQEAMAALVAWVAGPAPTRLPPAPTTTRPKPTSTTTTTSTTTSPSPAPGSP